MNACFLFQKPHGYICLCSHSVLRRRSNCSTIHLQWPKNLGAPLFSQLTDDVNNYPHNPVSSHSLAASTAPVLPALRTKTPESWLMRINEMFFKNFKLLTNDFFNKTICRFTHRMISPFCCQIFLLLLLLAALATFLLRGRKKKGQMVKVTAAKP